MRLLLFLAVLAPCFAQAPVPSSRWYRHLVEELMPFWNSPAALGNPIGAFPTLRCDDGSTVDFTRPCPEIGRNAWLFNERQGYLVALSRQIYTYGVIFHLSGNPMFLGYMKAGVDEFRRNWVDRQGGGMFTRKDLRTGAMGPRREIRNAQELAYGLLGIGFYYYLTRDAEVLPDILWLKSYIFSNYWNDDLGAMQWTIADDGANWAFSRRLTATLDQMNAYMVLLSPILPEPYAREWKADLVRLSRTMIRHFYVPAENLFYLTSDRPADLDPARTGTDFGHSIKALWMIRFTGLMSGDGDLVEFAERNGPRILERAFQAANGSWASGVAAGGAVDLNKSWWIYAELDQFSATISLTDPLHGRYLPATAAYWFSRFTDPYAGEVWTTVDGRTGLPLADQPKQWPWKNGYHSTEHAMVGYITSRQRESQPFELYYAYPPDSGTRPYFFAGRLLRADEAGGTWRAVFDSVR
jgi:mannose/cellobiose epimerase-like protein (N-acyl-D-glucosamine 2-epimerase family)